MYNNVGRTIKFVAKILFGIGIGVSFFIWIALLSVGLADAETAVIFYSLIALVSGLFISWITSLLLYGFGQLIENTDTLARWDKEDNNT
jgi:hypothetical protein